MPRAKGTKNKKETPKAKPAHKPTETDQPVFTPPFTEEDVKKEVSESVGLELEEGVTPKDKKVPTGDKGACHGCVHTSVLQKPLPHDGTLHYGTPARHCNAAGCRCTEYRP